MINRRAFLASVAVLAVLRATSARAELSDPNEVFLNRLTFGASPESRTDLARMGRSAWLDWQIAMPSRDADLDGRLGAAKLRIEYEAASDQDDGVWPAVNELRPLWTLYADPADLLHLIDWEQKMAWPERVRPADEVILAALTRAVHAPAQLREVMTQFWHDHFNVNAHKDEYTANFYPSYDATLRRHAFGNFRELLVAVAQSPAMLVYLNNADSSASPANENYARELLELHTLGQSNYLNHLYNRWSEVPGAREGMAEGYIDEDVYEVARAFTGWTVGDGRWISEGTDAPRTGQFYYAESWHDPYQKRILGREFAPNRAALADGEEVLDMLATHPGTARFICTKIARRLLTDDPDSLLIDRLSALFLAQSDAPDQIAQVVRALALDPAFEQPPTKLRRPFEFLAALYRGSGASISATDNSYRWQLSRAGWLQHTFPPPTGHSDRADDWSTGTGLLRLADYALYGHDDWFGATETRLSKLVPPEVKSLDDLMQFWSGKLTGLPENAPPELLDLMSLTANEALPRDEGSLHDLSSVILTFAALSPQFMNR